MVSISIAPAAGWLVLGTLSENAGPVFFLSLLGVCALMIVGGFLFDNWPERVSKAKAAGDEGGTATAKKAGSKADKRQAKLEAAARKKEMQAKLKAAKQSKGKVKGKDKGKDKGKAEEAAPATPVPADDAPAAEAAPEIDFNASDEPAPPTEMSDIPPPDGSPDFESHPG